MSGKTSNNSGIYIMMLFIIILIIGFFSWQFYLTKKSEDEAAKDILLGKGLGELKEYALPGDAKTIEDVSPECKAQFEGWKKWVISDTAYYNQVKARAAKDKISVYKRLELEWIGLYNQDGQGCYKS